MTARKIIPAPDPVESDEPDAIESDVPPPPRRPRVDGSRRVSVITREEYIAPPPASAAATVEEDDDDEPAKPAAAAAAPLPVELAPPVRSPLDSLLAELSSDLSGLTIYVIRKEDTGTSGLTFRNPCLKQRTAGSLDFREQFSNPMNIDLAVQRRWGGGEYQLQVRRGGTYLQAWSTVIEDLPLGQNPVGPDAPIAGYNGAVPVTPTFEDQLERFARVSKILGLTNERNHPAPEPVDPLTQAQGMVGMMQGFIELGKAMTPPPPVVTGKGSTLETLLNAGVSILGTPQGQQIAGGITNFLGAAAMRIVSPPVQPMVIAANGSVPSPIGGGSQEALRGAPAHDVGIPAHDGFGGVADAVPAQSETAPPDLSDPRVFEFALVNARQTFINKMVDAIGRNRHHGEMVAWVIDVFEMYPALVETLRNELTVTLSMPVNIVLAQISGMVNRDLAAIPTATDWLEDFRTDLLDEPAFLAGSAVTDGAATHASDAGPEPVFNMDPDAATAGVGSQVSGVGEEAAEGAGSQVLGDGEED